MAGWKSIEIKQYRAFVTLSGKDCVCGIFLGMIPDAKYPGQNKVVLDSIAGQEFEIRVGVLLSQYLAVHSYEMTGKILSIATVGKKNDCMTYRIGIWLGTSDEFEKDVSNVGIIERTHGHIARAMSAQKKKA